MRCNQAHRIIAFRLFEGKIYRLQESQFPVIPPRIIPAGGHEIDRLPVCPGDRLLEKLGLIRRRLLILAKRHGFIPLEDETESRTCLFPRRRFTGSGYLSAGNRSFWQLDGSKFRRR